MNDKRDIFDQLLGDKLSEMREMPSEGLFDRIEATLAAMGQATPAATQEAEQQEAEAPEVVEQQPKRVVPLWSRGWVRASVAVAAAIALFVGVVVVTDQSAPEEVVVAVAQPEQTTQPEQQPKVEIQGEQPSVEEWLAAAAPHNLLTSASQQLPASVKAAGESVVDEGEAESIKQMTEVVADNSKKSADAAKSTSVKRTKRKAQRKSNAEIEEYWRNVLGQEEFYDEQQEGVRLLSPTDVSLYATNVGFNQGHIQVNNLANSEMMINEMVASGNDATLSGTPTFMKAPRKEVSELKHYMPVSVGLSASFALGEWLALESGLTYTNLYSKSDNSGKVSNYHYTQNLHYIGIPLAVNINLVDFGSLSIYGKAGSSIEFCVAAKKRQYIDGAINLVEDIATEGVQIGLNAAAGVNYRLVDNLGLFAEAGVGYWTATKPQPSSWRTDHPLGFSLMAGVRFAFR